MNEELQQKLLEALTSTMEAAGDVKDFTLAQVPEILQQALMWYGVYYFTLFAFGVLILFGVYKHLKYQFWTSRNAEKPNIYWDYYGDPKEMHVVSLLHILTILASGALINLQWLQIWIMPKLWLLEWAKELK